MPSNGDLSQMRDTHFVISNHPSNLVQQAIKHLLPQVTSLERNVRERVCNLKSIIKHTKKCDLKKL